MRLRQRNLLFGVAGGLLLGVQSVVAAPVIWERIEDPLVRAAQFDLLMGDPFAAVTQLEADLLQGRITHRPAQAQLVLGSLYLANGAHHKAARIFEALGNSNQPQAVRNQAWLSLAQVQYQRGQSETALASLQRIQGTLPSQAQQEFLLLSAMLHMQQEKFEKAIAALRQLGQKSLVQQLSEKSVWATYGRFNLGVALFRQGEEEEGRKLLQEVGSAAADTEEGRALRDKANLTLAYHYLGKNAPEKAQQYFVKTRLQGPMSSRALLGLGRAYSAKGEHKKSLVPWLKLSKLNPSDPAVQDGLLAVPLAFGKLEAFKQALEYYQLALEKYKAEMEQVREAEAAVNSGALMDQLARSVGRQAADQRWLVQELPNTPGGRYLWQLFATNEFQETLKNYAQLRLSLGRLEQWSSQIDEAKELTSAERSRLEKKVLELQGELLAMLERIQDHLKMLAQETLERRKQRLLGYAGEARFSMAQIYDYAAKRWGNEQ
jgi:TolA-binding protein